MKLYDGIIQMITGPIQRRLACIRKAVDSQVLCVRHPVLYDLLKLLSFLLDLLNLLLALFHGGPAPGAVAAKYSVAA